MLQSIGSLNVQDADITNMPKYDYECPGEEIVIEYSLPIVHSNPLCETCGAVMRQVYQATPAIFKGRGWGAKP